MILLENGKGPGGEDPDAPNPDLLVITSYYPPPFQAASNRVISLARYLRRNHRKMVVGLMVLGKNAPENGGEGKEPWGVSYHSCSFRPTTLNPFFLLWATMRCVLEIKNRSPRYVMATTPPANTLIAGILGSRITGCPLIIDLQDDWEGVYLDSFPEKGLLRWIYRLTLLAYGSGARLLYSSAELMLTADETLGKIFRDKYDGRITAVLNGVDMDELARAWKSTKGMEEAQVSEDLPTLVFSGNISWKPGIIHVVAPYIGKQESGGWRINIIGGGTDETVGRLKQLFGVGPIRFLGSLPREEALSYIASSDAALLAMEHSYQIDHLIPVKLMDYLSAGAPVLAVVPPYCLSARKIEEFSAGIVVPNNEPERIPGVLRDLSHPTWRKRTRKTRVKIASMLDSSKQWRKMISKIPTLPNSEDIGA